MHIHLSGLVAAVGAPLLGTLVLLAWVVGLVVVSFFAFLIPFAFCYEHIRDFLGRRKSS